MAWTWPVSGSCGTSARNRSGRPFAASRLIPWALILFSAFLVAACSSGNVIPATPLPTPESASTGPIGTPVPTLEANHIPVGQPFQGYNSNPPTSGPHWGQTARCGVYPDGLANETVVHNLEHGQVVMSYNLKDAAEVGRLTRTVQSLPDWGSFGILRFYPDIPEGQVAMTVWGVLDIQNGVNEARIAKFWEMYAHNRLSAETKAVGPLPCS